MHLTCFLKHIWEIRLWRADIYFLFFCHSPKYKHINRQEMEYVSLFNSLWLDVFFVESIMNVVENFDFQCLVVIPDFHNVNFARCYYDLILYWCCAGILSFRILIIMHMCWISCCLAHADIQNLSMLPMNVPLFFK